MGTTEPSVARPGQGPRTASRPWVVSDPGSHTSRPHPRYFSCDQVSPSREHTPGSPMTPPLHRPPILPHQLASPAGPLQLQGRLVWLVAVPVLCAGPARAGEALDLPRLRGEPKEKGSPRLSENLRPASDLAQSWGRPAPWRQLSLRGVAGSHG